jgi:pimeloyl-ACP methyl ester carboxylesterase
MKRLHPLVYLKNLVIDNPVGSLVCLILVVWIIVVRVYNEYSIHYGDIQVASTIEKLTDLKNGSTAADLDTAYHFAVLSAEVYGDLDEHGRHKRQWEAKNCDHGAVYSQWQQLILPDSIPDKPNDREGEQMSLDSELIYGVWYRDLPNNAVEVVIAFAGTNGPGDIWSNLFWLTKYWPGGWGQYDLARTLGPTIEDYVNEIFAKKENIRIVAVGHSLGGGLAHQAAYAAKKIDRVFAFDSSSVTGFYSVDKDIRDAAKIDMRIYRIHERGEILAYLRSFMAVFFL